MVASSPMCTVSASRRSASVPPWCEGSVSRAGRLVLVAPQAGTKTRVAAGSEWLGALTARYGLAAAATARRSPPLDVTVLAERAGQQSDARAAWNR